jgi:hypothetical protein
MGNMPLYMGEVEVRSFFLTCIRRLPSILCRMSRGVLPPQIEFFHALNVGLRFLNCKNYCSICITYSHPKIKKFGL